MIDTKLETRKTEVRVARPLHVSPDVKPNFEVSKQKNRLIAAEAMEKATVAGNASNLSLARELLNTAVKKISESISAKDPFCVG